MPSFVEIGPPVPEKKIFDGFLPYRGGHLGRVTSIMSSNFHFLVPELSYKIWLRTAQKFLRKSGLNSSMYTTLGQGQEMTMTLNTRIPS